MLLEQQQQRQRQRGRRRARGESTFLLSSHEGGPGPGPRQEEEEEVVVGAEEDEDEDDDERLWGSSRRRRGRRGGRMMMMMGTTEDEEDNGEVEEGGLVYRILDGQEQPQSTNRATTMNEGERVLATSTFTLPLVGTRDLTDLFQDIFQDQEMGRRPSTVRRVRQPRGVGPVGKMVRAPPNWYLRPGQTWTGWQHVQHWPPGTSEKWNVRVVIEHVDFDKGEVFGSMTASDVPGAASPVVTYFEGEIIDNENATFYSDPDASARTCLSELRHWSRFPAFRPLRDGVLEEDGRTPALAESKKVFMRWKEKCFLVGGDCRLTIAGVYYVTLDRVNGDINAYYFDPNSAPEQKMMLRAGTGNQPGYSLPAQKLA